MLPVANRPMMEHVIHLLRRHGFDEIVVTVAFLANAIKTYFGDGSEYGVSIIYADEPMPLGTAGSVLQRHGAPRRALPRHLRRRDHRHRPHQDRRASTTTAEAMATIGLIQVENPLEFGIVITREDGTIERFLEKPTWGQVFSDTINTGHLRARPGGVRLHRAPGARSTSRARCSPRMLADGKPLFGAIGRGLLGGRRHPRGLPAAPTRTCSTSGCCSTSPASRSPTACGSGRAPRSRPTPRSWGRR